MNNKEIKFSAVLDTSAFDASINSLQNELNNILNTSQIERMRVTNLTRASGLGFGTGVRPEDKARIEQAEKRERDLLAKFIKERLEDEDKINKSLDEQIKKRKTLLELAEKDADTIEKIKETEKNIENLTQRRVINQQVLSKALESAGDRGKAGEGAGGGGVFSGILRQLTGGAGGTVAGIFSALSFLSTAASSVGTSIITDPRRAREAQAGAVTSMSTPLMNALTRGALEEMFFVEERTQAIKEARKEIASQKTFDILGLAGKIIAPVAGGALTGLAFGGPLGSLALGALGLGAGLYGASDDLIGFLTGRKTQEYRQREGVTAAQNFEAIKALNPLKNFAFQEMQNRGIARLPFQRMLNLSDAEMNEAVLLGNQFGFTEQSTLQSLSGLLQAGAGGTATRNLATLSSMLKRAGVTQADTIAGTLAAVNLKDDVQTQNVLLRLLSKGTELGLNESKFTREQSKLFETLSDYVVKTGAQTTEGQTAIISAMTQGGIANRSMAGVSAISEARSMAMISQTTNVGSAIRAAAIERDPALSKLPSTVKMSLLQMNSDQILGLKGTEMGASIERMTGKTLEEIADIFSPASTEATGTLDRAIGNLIKAKSGGRQADIDKAMVDIMGGLSLGVGGFTGMTAAGREQFIQNLMVDTVRKKQKAGQELTPFEQSLLAEADKQAPMSELLLGGIAQPDLKKTGDILEANLAERDKQALDIMTKFSISMDGTIEPLQRFTNELIKATTELSKLVSEGASGDRIKAAQDRVLNLSTQARFINTNSTQPVTGPSGQ